MAAFHPALSLAVQNTALFFIFTVLPAPPPKKKIGKDTRPLVIWSIIYLFCLSALASLAKITSLPDPKCTTPCQTHTHTVHPSWRLSLLFTKCPNKHPSHWVSQNQDQHWVWQDQQRANECVSVFELVPGFMVWKHKYGMCMTTSTKLPTFFWKP